MSSIHCRLLHGLVFFAALVQTGHAQRVTGSVPVGSPRSLAVNPVTNKVYVTNEAGDSVTVIDGASNSTATVATGNTPDSVAVNPVTNKIYVANQGSGSVTVIDGTTNKTTTVGAGTEPWSVAVNPVTNKIYVANFASGNVTVIDGATNSTTTVATGAYSSPQSIAVNPVTNKIYVADWGINNVTVIDGATNSTTTVATGREPQSIAVNPITNKIYVANSSSNSVTVIDGDTNNTTTVTAGDYPWAVAVNPVTNKAYVANIDPTSPTWTGSVTVIDGVTNGTTTVAADSYPISVAVNSTTNQVYVVNATGEDVTVIDGATNSTKTLAVGSKLGMVALNPVTNKIYVAGSDSVTVIDGDTNNTTTVTAGDYPWAVAVNPVTNKIYVANNGIGSSSSVTVIDGDTNNTATVAAGIRPGSIAVNPVTNKIYVANQGSNDVTVIDGATLAASTVEVGLGPYAVAVNPVTNKIYVADSGHGSSATGPGDVTVIDGATNSTTTVIAGLHPGSVGVNPVTNRIYVLNSGSATVTVIDGTSNSTTSVPTGQGPTTLDDFAAQSVAVNPVTNKIYVANASLPGQITVIDGITNNTTTIGGVSYPISLDVNPVTNKIYVANGNKNSVTMIDGTDNSTASLAIGTYPNSVVVNPVTNKIYVGNRGGPMSVIDGISGTTSTVAANGLSLAVNPVTNKIYLTNNYGGDVTIIDEQQVQTNPLTTEITPLADDQTSIPTPTFQFNALSSTVTTASQVYFQLDTWQNGWTAATTSGPSCAATLSLVQPGFHTLYAYAVDGQEATSTQAGSPATGAIQAYPFLVKWTPPGVVSLSPSSGFGTTQTFTGVYTEPNGAANLTTVEMLFSNPFRLAHACYVLYYSSSNLLFLENDAGTGLSAGVTPGSAGQVANSQCTLLGAGSSISVAGDNLTLNAQLTFSEGYLLPKNSYLRGTDTYGIDSGWVLKGFWGSLGSPSVVSISPTAGAGATQTFVGVYSDPNGAADIATARMMFNNPFGVAHACYVLYYSNSNLLFLENDAGTGLTAGVTPGSAGQVSNSQCTLLGAGSSVSAAGNNLTLRADLAFSGSFLSAKNVYLVATSNNWPQFTVESSGWVLEGTWGISVGSPAIVSLSPSSGSGPSQTFTAVYSDLNGTSDLATGRILIINPADSEHPLSIRDACYVLYYRSTNTLYLEVDNGTGFAGGVTPGSSGQVSNSQCTLIGTGSSVSVAGNNLTMNVNLTFSASFLTPKSVYLLATGNEWPQDSTASTGWVLQGSWTP